MTLDELTLMLEQSRGQEVQFTVDVMLFEETKELVRKTNYPYRIETNGRGFTFRIFVGSTNELKHKIMVSRIENAKQLQLDKVIKDLFETGSSLVPFINNEVLKFIENQLKQCNIVAKHSFDNDSVKFYL